MYRVLMESGGVGIPPYIEKWEKELDIKLNEREVWQILKRVNATSVNCKLSEMNYKCLARMYITPNRAHRIQKETSRLSWRMQRNRENGAHLVAVPKNGKILG